ncbi:MAG: hypothetical protein K2H01_01460 [Ruminococcus sp.]|nr:hypothetical protein [Ruminococcus sp.]
MKNIKKFVYALSAILIMNTCSLSVDAGGGYNILSLLKEEGYVDGRADYEYTYYNSNNNNHRYISYYNFRYNYLSLVFSESADKTEIYEKYCKDLDFDVHYIYDEGEFYDVPDENDNKISPETVEQKYDSIKSMIGKMYMDGVITYALYNPVRVQYDLYDIPNALYCTFDGTESELSDIIKKYSDNAVIKEVTNHENMYNVEFFDVQSLSQLDDISDKLKAYENIQSSNGSIDMSMAEHYVSYPAVNLLDPYICDIDGSGKADITDATVILTAYAESAAGLQKAAADNKMDVNGDGEVNIEDATYVLTYYAEAAAGIR